MLLDTKCHMSSLNVFLFSNQSYQSSIRINIYTFFQKRKSPNGGCCSHTNPHPPPPYKATSGTTSTICVDFFFIATGVLPAGPHPVARLSNVAPLFFFSDCFFCPLFLSISFSVWGGCPVRQTSKYEVWSFMPKFLAMEFHPRKKVANLYFLIVSCMQVWYYGILVCVVSCGVWPD